VIPGSLWPLPQRQRWFDFRGRSLPRGLVVRAFALLTFAGATTLSQADFPGLGSLASVALNVLRGQGLALGVHLWGSGPGNLGYLYTLAIAPFLGTTLAMPLLAYVVLTQVTSAPTDGRWVAVELAAFAMWLTYLCRVAVGYGMLLPFAADWMAGPARAPIPPSGAVPFLFAPIYIGSAANLLLWSGLLVEGPIGVYLMARLGAIRAGGVPRVGLVAMAFVVLLMVQLAGPRYPFELAIGELVLAWLTFEAGLLLTLRRPA